jgi:hypothetical protein
MLKGTGGRNITRKYRCSVTRRNERKERGASTDSRGAALYNRMQNVEECKMWRRDEHQPKTELQQSQQQHMQDAKKSTGC